MQSHHHSRLYRPLCDLNGRTNSAEYDSLPLIFEEGENEKENNTTPSKFKVMKSRSHADAPTSSTPLTRKQATPKTPKFVPKNPFDAELLNQLHRPICSPSVFQVVASPSKSFNDENFDWPIEDISRIKPVPIEEDPESNYHYSDPETDSKIQEAIDTFFKKEKQIVPSPFPTSADRPRLFKLSNSSIDVASQTALSLPPILPPELEAALRPYFNQDENDKVEQCAYNIVEEEEEEISFNQSGMRRKLNFFYQENVVTSPLETGKWQDGYSRSNMQLSRDVRSPTLSPIVKSSEDENVSSPIAINKTSALQISYGNMSVDMTSSVSNTPTTPLTRRTSILINNFAGDRRRMSLSRKFSSNNLIDQDQSMDSVQDTPPIMSPPTFGGRATHNHNDITDHGYHTDSRAYSGFWGKE